MGGRKYVLLKHQPNFIMRLWHPIRRFLSLLAIELANRTYNVSIIIGTYILTELANAYFANGLNFSYMTQVSYYFYPTGQVVPTQAR